MTARISDKDSKADIEVSSVLIIRKFSNFSTLAAQVSYLSRI